MNKKFKKQIIKSLQEFIIIIVLLPIMLIVSLLPFTWGIKIGKYLGIFGYKIATKRAKIAKINLKKCFPTFSDKRIENLVKKNFIQTTIGSIIETSWSFFLSKKKLSQLKYNLNIPQQYYDNLGVNPIIISSGHSTSLEILAHGCPTKNFIMSIVYRKLPFKILDWFFIKSKTKAEVNSIRHKDVTSIIKCLKEKKVLWIATDQDSGSRTKYFVDFFGNQVASIDTLPRLAKKFNAKVFVNKISRIKNNPPTYDYQYQEIKDITNKSAKQIVAEYHQILTEYFKKRPSQYLWLHKRFKTQKDGSNPYINI